MGFYHLSFGVWLTNPGWLERGFHLQGQTDPLQAWYDLFPDRLKLADALNACFLRWCLLVSPLSSQHPPVPEWTNLRWLTLPPSASIDTKVYLGIDGPKRLSVYFPESHQIVFQSDARILDSLFQCSIRLHILIALKILGIISFESLGYLVSDFMVISVCSSLFTKWVEHLLIFVGCNASLCWFTGFFIS